MTKSLQMSRRDFLNGAAAGLTTLTLPFGNLSLAKVNSNSRFVLILARGGMDTLALFPPHGDPDYRKMRGRLALPSLKEGGMLKLDDLFGLNPAASQLLPFWARNEMILLPAVSTGYKGDDHREAQAILESGLDKPATPPSGWLNRAIGAMGSEAVPALAISEDLPLVLAGPDKGKMIHTAKAPPRTLPGFYQRVSLLYQDDPLLATVLSQELADQDQRSRKMSGNDREADGRARPVSDLPVMAELAAASLRDEAGARIAVMEISGWDIHQGQGTGDGPLARKFTALAGGLETLASEMGDQWRNTVVVVASEFGRTIAANAEQGTDHGWAAPMLVLGGPVKGGRVVGAWPGLASPTTESSGKLLPTEDVRALFKSVLTHHFGMKPALVEKQVFPGSAKIKPLDSLFKG